MLDRNTYFALVHFNTDSNYSVSIGTHLSDHEIQGLIVSKNVPKNLFKGYAIGTCKKDKIRDVLTLKNNGIQLELRNRPYRIFLWEGSPILDTKTTIPRTVTEKDFYIIAQSTKIDNIVIEEKISTNTIGIKRRRSRTSIPRLKQKAEANEKLKECSEYNIHAKPIATRQRARRKAIQKYGNTPLKPWQKGGSKDKYTPIYQDLTD